MSHIESLLSARLFLAPQLVNNRIYFLSNLSGQISLYVMNNGGSVPEPLLPPNIALQNPHLMVGYSFYVLPKLEKIIVMIDSDGDEVYQPMMIPIDGGYPEQVFRDQFHNYRVHLVDCDPEQNLVYFSTESRLEPMHDAFQGNLETGNLQVLGRSKWGSYIDGISANHDRVTMLDGYTAGDHVVYLWSNEVSDRRLLYGTPIENRQEGQEIPINSISDLHFTKDDGLLFFTSLFDDKFGLGYFKVSEPEFIKPVTINGIFHQGAGEFNGLHHLKGNRYSLKYNIDGCSWLYEGIFDEESLSIDIDSVICGRGRLSNGVIDEFYYDKTSDNYIFSFSTATFPTQIFSVGGENRKEIIQHTNERLLGLSQESLASGEDASFTSFDGTRISARLYFPSSKLGYEGQRPLVYYIHGGPQSQEKPDFSWFSMPLIQQLTLKGFAVFVPNVRGSTGYGLNYMKQVDKDWGGKDRLDHVYAMEKILPQEKRVDVSRSGVVGRSYGGYMTLTLAGRHPELWSAAVDMFGPYNLITFSDRIPETWKPYFVLALGDPIKDKDFLNERSPKTYINNINFPMLIIQGKNDPRVVEEESRELVDSLRANGKDIEYLMFENEGHDVLKYENRVSCYNAITNFFEAHLQPEK